MSCVPTATGLNVDAAPIDSALDARQVARNHGGGIEECNPVHRFRVFQNSYAAIAFGSHALLAPLVRANQAVHSSGWFAG